MQGRLQVPEDLDDVAFALSGKCLFGPTQRLDFHGAVLGYVRWMGGKLGLVSCFTKWSPNHQENVPGLATPPFLASIAVPRKGCGVGATVVRGQERE
jgi:hypothetical protein